MCALELGAGSRAHKGALGCRLKYCKLYRARARRSTGLRQAASRLNCVHLSEFATCCLALLLTLRCGLASGAAPSPRPARWPAARRAQNSRRMYFALGHFRSRRRRATARSGRAHSLSAGGAYVRHGPPNAAAAAHWAPARTWACERWAAMSAVLVLLSVRVGRIVMLGAFGAAGAEPCV